MIGLVLFAQLSVASYACPAMSDQPTEAREAATSAAMDMPDSSRVAKLQPAVAGTPEQLDANAATVCVEHCRFGQQSNASTPAPVIQAAFLLPLYLLRLEPLAPTHARAEAAIERPMTMAAPPLAVLHCCFRI